ncbi:MAG TPA: hypothetical protein VH540_16710 [Ktedonobacterales bacterium]|jgi:hypothetical protein
MPSVASRVGGLVCVVGAGLVLIGYSLPWFTYRVWNQPPNGAFEVVTWTGWREVAAGFPLSLVLFGLPLLMPLLTAGIAGGLAFRTEDLAARRALGIALVITLFTLAAITVLLWWVFTSDSGLPLEPPPLFGTGLLWLYVGYLAVLAGGALMCLKQPHQAVPQVA